jgi:hypothetical protein
MSSKIKQSLVVAGSCKGHCASSVRTNVLQPRQPNEARGQIMIPLSSIPEVVLLRRRGYGIDLTS